MEPIQLAQTDAAILHCRETVFALRDHLEKDNYLEQVNRMMLEGYHMAFINSGDKAVCVAGFRFEEMLHRGRSMYIDDLVTLPEYRSQKYGSRMLDWLYAHAREHRCRQVHLDSGVQRFDAHRFYLNKGFRISSHHFVIDLEGSGGN